jgi:hypothetical protein
MMNIAKAFKLGNKENKGIRRKVWGKKIVVYHGLDNLIMLVDKGHPFPRKFDMCASDLLAKDWILSNEPYHGPKY